MCMFTYRYACVFIEEMCLTSGTLLANSLWKPDSRSWFEVETSEAASKNVASVTFSEPLLVLLAASGLTELREESPFQRMMLLIKALKSTPGS